ncbi:transposase [Aeribacillus sp. FSL K6-2848]|uniref:transposase n=1 Tax=Aeribacillus sp. FSL K6-2848 TaxID=2954612 RepID=UPI0030F58C82
MKKRNRYTAEFKAKVVLEVLREEQTVNEIAAKYELSPVMVSRWKVEFLERSSMVFEKGSSEVDKIRKEYDAVLVKYKNRIFLVRPAWIHSIG